MYIFYPWYRAQKETAGFAVIQICKAGVALTKFTVHDYPWIYSAGFEILDWLDLTQYKTNTLVIPNLMVSRRIDVIFENHHSLINISCGP